MQLKKAAINGVQKSLTALAKQLVLTSCWFVCHRPEVPQELLKK